jgi:hypothetical protein
MQISASLRKAGLFALARRIIGERAIVRIQRLAALPFGRRLTMLGHIYWTDKAYLHRYTQHYERHLYPLRERRVNLLEIGIGGGESPTWGGASLRMWRDYFPRGTIHGLDIHDKVIAEERVRVHRGDQSDTEFVRRLGREHGPFDVIIDDGSHVNAHITTSFDALFEEHLRSGGYYVIEDMETAYKPSYGGGPAGSPGTSVELVKRLIDSVNLEPQKVAAVHAYEQIAFIQRA